MIQLREMLSPRPEQLPKLAKDRGIGNVVARLNGAEQAQRMLASEGKRGFFGTATEDRPCGEAVIRRDVEIFKNFGLKVSAIETTAPLDLVRLGLKEGDEQIDYVITQLQAMGRLGIETLSTSWTAVSSWGRTSIETIGRGGALVTSFRASNSELMPPLVNLGEISDNRLWDGLPYFVDALIPVAELAGLKLGMHPGDPPRMMGRNVPHILRPPDAFPLLLAMRPSESNGITFCQGNFALMEADLTECMRAYAEVGFDGPMRPDHVPTMDGESNDRPAYGTFGRLFAIGYIRGLEHAVFGKPGFREDLDTKRKN